MKIFFITILSVFSLSLSAQNILYKKVYSPKMQDSIETIIVTPDLKPDVRYKTVYILHGYSGNPTRTVKKDIPDLVAKAKAFQTIYILPNGHYNSWYVDSPVDPHSQYQTFIGHELVAYIDQNFPTDKRREARGILGWSMGGYGALHIGVAYAQSFSIVGSSCGAIDFDRFGAGYEGYQVNKVLGRLESLNRDYRIYASEEKMKVAGQYYILDCGTEDTQMIEMNRVFHQHLTAKNVNHLYTESPGEHDTKYWSSALSNQLALFENYFNNERL